MVFWQARLYARHVSGRKVKPVGHEARPTVSHLSREEIQKLHVGLRLRATGDHHLGDCLDFLLHEGAAEEMDAFEGLCVDEQFLFASAARGATIKNPRGKTRANERERKARLDAAEIAAVDRADFDDFACLDEERHLHGEAGFEPGGLLDI